VGGESSHPSYLSSKVDGRTIPISHPPALSRTLSPRLRSVEIACREGANISRAAMTLPPVCHPNDRSRRPGGREGIIINSTLPQEINMPLNSELRKFKTPKKTTLKKCLRKPNSGPPKHDPHTPIWPYTRVPVNPRSKPEAERPTRGRYRSAGRERRKPKSCPVRAPLFHSRPFRRMNANGSIEVGGANWACLGRHPLAGVATASFGRA
jgi:hypothetical protein